MVRETPGEFEQKLTLLRRALPAMIHRLSDPSSLMLVWQIHSRGPFKVYAQELTTSRL